MIDLLKVLEFSIMTTMWLSVAYFLPYIRFISKDIDICITGYDRYAKSYVHLLFMPKRKEMMIDTLQQATRDHLKLLELFAQLSKEIAEHLVATDQVIARMNSLDGTVFLAGFHSVPSLTPIHMHFLSRDLANAAMKKRDHFMSFTTPFFLPLATVYSELRKNGSVSDKSDFRHFINGDIISHINGENYGRKFAKLKHHLERNFRRYQPDVLFSVSDEMATSDETEIAPIDDEESVNDTNIDNK